MRKLFYWLVLLQCVHGPTTCLILPDCSPMSSKRFRVSMHCSRDITNNLSTMVTVDSLMM
ncbi:hypothetical protein KC19_VG182200 [Ceratodon purpureus]|uniref:Uncharacterized protein n=1 Tax=Ceratodon purpureus TaxID=3225 RepID=A0A8T0HR70_CERPU|nr:hypothetical protein KC19_VG182200 [Ceratodon purpureus]